MDTENLSGWTRGHVFHESTEAAERSTRVVMWITAAMMVIEIAAGWWYNSMALLAVMVAGSVERIISPQPIHYQEAIVVAVVGLVVDEIRAAVETGEDAGDARITDLHVWRVGKNAYSCALTVVTHDHALTATDVRRRLAVHEEIVHSTIAIYDETSAKNENFRKIYADLSKFRADQNRWFRFTEATFDRFMQAQKL
jgi:Co/Zn/Cd efflux system component